MGKMSRLFLLVLVAAFCIYGVSDAAPLQIIGTTNSGNLIYEEAQGLVWLDYEHQIAPFGTWNPFVDWADGLNTNLHVGWVDPLFAHTDWASGWRLPELVEWQHLYSTTLDNPGWGDPGFDDPRNTGLLTALSEDLYWTNTQNADNEVAGFSFWNGAHYWYEPEGQWSETPNLAFGVRGDVSPIPEPSTLALLGVGLLAAGIGFIRRRRAQ